jgi:type I restriction enzyme S subunit
VITKQNNLHQLPKGWTWTRLGEMAEIILGQSPPSSTYNESGNGLPFYQGKLEFGKIYPTPKKWCVAPKKIAEKGDVLISVRAPVGPTNICPEKSCIGRGLAAIRGLGGIEKFFILYLIRTFENVLAGKGTGTTFNAISGNQLKGFEIPLPPLPEQCRIVAKIEELFTNLDAGGESLKKVKTHGKRYRQAVLKYAFEGKLTEGWRKTHKDEIEPASILLERIKEERKKNLKGKYKELLPIDMSELPELPQSWIWVRLGEVSDTTSGGTPSRKKKQYYGGSIPWLKSGELKDGVINATEESITDEGLANSSTRIIPRGNLLIALYGATVGKLGVLGIDSAINQAICAIFPNGGISREFLFWYLRKHRNELLNIRKGGAQPNISQDVVRNIVLPLPSLQEQQNIVEEIENRMSLIKEVETVLEKSLKQAERLRQGILKQAFEGKLVPQDPSDEPADKLLQRIREERVKSKGEKDTNKNKNNSRQLELSSYVK